VRRYSDWLRSGRSGYRIPVGTRFSASVQTGRGAYPAYCTMGTVSLSWGIKRPRRGVDHPPQSGAEVKERLELCPYFPSGPSWPVVGWILQFWFTLLQILCRSRRVYKKWLIAIFWSSTFASETFCACWHAQLKVWVGLTGLHEVLTDRHSLLLLFIRDTAHISPFARYSWGSWQIVNWSTTRELFEGLWPTVCEIRHLSSDF
jgi:hypothetical protein